MSRVYTSRTLLGLTWSEFYSLVRCFTLDCTMSRDTTFGEWVRFTPKDMAELAKQVDAMAGHETPSAVYSAMTASLRALLEMLRTTDEWKTGQNLTVYQRSR